MKLRAIRASVAAFVVAVPTPVIAWLVLVRILHPRAPALVGVTLGCAFTMACRAGVEWWRWWLAQTELAEMTLLNELADELCTRGASVDARVKVIEGNVADMRNSLRLVINARSMKRFRSQLRPDLVDDERLDPVGGEPLMAHIGGHSNIVILDAARFDAQYRKGHVAGASVERTTPAARKADTLLGGIPDLS